MFEKFAWWPPCATFVLGGSPNFQTDPMTPLQTVLGQKSFLRPNHTQTVEGTNGTTAVGASIRYRGEVLPVKPTKPQEPLPDHSQYLLPARSTQISHWISRARLKPTVWVDGPMGQSSDGVIRL